VTIMTASRRPFAGSGGMQFSVDAWDPSYGTSVADGDLPASSARIDLGVEVPVPAWHPMAMPGARGRLVGAPSTVLFVDGVRRVEARAWIHDLTDDGGPATTAAPAICASYASGVVCCCTRGAHLLAAHVRRGLFTTAGHADDVTTAAGRYQVFKAAKNSPEGLTLAVQNALLALEVLTAAQARTGLAAHELTQTVDDPEAAQGDQFDDLATPADVPAVRFWPGPAAGGQPAVGSEPAAGRPAGQKPPGGPDAVPPAGHGDDLLVLDGPLRGRAHLPRTLGFIKTHHSQYLPAAQHAVVGSLGPGERTPVFLMGTNWDRFSWYLRLPSAPGAPWAGVARVECGAGLAPGEAVALADLSQVTLPRFASREYKDGRAPQNLYPIAGLERSLRRRLGDPTFLYRSLRRAAST
jgi:hypothetical protein